MSLLTDAEAKYYEALRENDNEKAEVYFKIVQEVRHRMNNPMEETEAEMDAGAMSVYSGLDPMQIEYAKTINAQIDATNLALNQMFIAPPNVNAKSLQSTPGSYVTTGNHLSWTTAVKPMAIFKEPTQADKDFDKRRHLKLFVHFAKQFADRYPNWTVVPDPADPLHNVHLLHKGRGAMIHNLYPMNEMAVYGGPATWTEPRKELGQHLPIVKINTQEFWGWCVGMDDVPEWMLE